MSRYLVDSNIVLIAWHEPHRIPAAVKPLLGDTKRFVSIATIWEISIKAGLGKLTTVPNLAASLTETGYEILPIEPAHAEAVRHLPHHHRDPFDRMLIAQAKVEELIILTTDRQFHAYDVTII